MNSMRMRHKNIIFTIFALIVLGVTWWWLRPDGDLEIYIEEGLTTSADEITKEMRYAVADTKSVNKLAIALNENMGKVLAIVPNAQMTLRRKLKLDDVFKIVAKFRIPASFLVFSGEFNVNFLLEILYEKLGYYNYTIVVSDFSKQVIREDEDRLYALISFHPPDPIGLRIPTKNSVPDLTFRDLVAKYMLDAVQNDLGTIDCTRNLCFSELPERTSLEATVDAFGFLSKGRKDARCDPTKSDVECIQENVRVFEDALKADAGNDFARLGLGLAQLRHFQLSRTNSSAVEAGRLLMDAVANINAAISSNELLGHLMSTEEWSHFVKSTPGLSDIDVSKEFIEKSDIYRKARREFVEANYTKAAKLIGDMPEGPSPVKPHIRSFELISRLLAAKKGDDAEPLLRQFEQLVSEQEDGATKATYAFVLCYWNNRNEARISKALALIEEAIEAASGDYIARLDRRVQKCICLALSSRQQESMAQLRNIRLTLPPDLDSQESAKYKRLYYNLGIAYSLTADQEKASEYLMHAIRLDSIYLKSITNQKLLEAFRQWTGYDKWINNMQQKSNF